MNSNDLRRSLGCVGVVVLVGIITSIIRPNPAERREREFQQLFAQQQKEGGLRYLDKKTNIFHLMDCSLLPSEDYNPITRDAAVKSGYKPCTTCKPMEDPLLRDLEEALSKQLNAPAPKSK
jgi:methylphosphotriester-DNA--protein-cysteine methyltransferase